MKFLKFRTYFLILLILFSARLAPAQCEGTYFKTTKPAFFNSERMDFYEGIPSKDLTGDGKTDMIGVAYNSATGRINRILILPADGQGGFSSQVIQIMLPTELSCCAIPVFIADYNNNGLNDVLVKLETNPPSVLIYVNQGNGTFSPLSPSSLTSNNEYVKNVVDINNDNFADLLTNAQDPSIDYYKLGNSNGTFGASVPIPPAERQIPADFNNDGKIDFPVQQQISSSQILRIYYNQGGGTFTLGNNSLDMGLTSIKGAKDFNNDGKIDLYGTRSGAFSVIKNLGNDTFSIASFPYPNVPSGVNFTSLKLGDFNGDGFTDFLLPTSLYPFYSVYTNDGTGNFIRRDYNVAIVDGFPFGDLDGDNKTDLVSTNPFRIPSYPLKRLFNSETRVTVQKNVCDKQGQTKIVDFNGDRITNKTLWRAGDARWRHQQSFFDTAGTSFFWGVSGDIPTPGDFDGDGKTDFAIYRPSNGYWYARRSSDLAWYVLQWGIAGDKPVPADFDGDGKTDAAVFRPSDGNWYIFYTGTLQHSIAHFGIAEDKPVPADFDGDDKADLAVFRPSTGVWYYLKSSDLNAVAIQWGISTDQPVPADFDGDLKADLAVFRAAEGNWYVLRSYNSQFAVFPFGLSGDVPQPGDYDGDNLLDLAIYRPSNNLWYTSYTPYSATFGEAGEVPISYILRVE
jgi:hypothetical protein